MNEGARYDEQALTGFLYRPIAGTRNCPGDRLLGRRKDQTLVRKKGAMLSRSQVTACLAAVCPPSLSAPHHSQSPPMASKAAQKRLAKEYVSMQKEPPPFVWAAPDEKNILTWNFLIRGPPDSPYSGGEYHGVLLFPSDYPFKPPGIKMFTPSGRFHPDRKICFSMSDFHPGSWNPAWSVATILTGLLSFMLSDEMTTGSVTSTEGHKRAFAVRSHSWNIAQTRFKEAFPEHCTPVMRDLPNMGEKEGGKPDITLTSLPQPERSSSTISSPRDVSSTTTPATAEEITRVPTGPPPPAPVPGWMTGWRHFIYEKWRLCAFIALAVLVSRISSKA